MAADDDAPERAEAILTRGVARYAEGDIQGAAALWREAAALRPDDDRLRAYLAWAESRLAVDEGAVARARAVRPEAPAGTEGPEGRDATPPADEGWLDGAATVGQASAIPELPEDAPGDAVPRPAADGGEATRRIVAHGDTLDWHPAIGRASLAGAPPSDDAEESVRLFLSRTPTKPNVVPDEDVPMLTEERVAALAEARQTPQPVPPGAPVGIIEEARRAFDAGDLDAAFAAAERALADLGKRAARLLAEHAAWLRIVYEHRLGDRGRRIRLGHLPADLDPRSAFLLSRVDGNLSIDDLLDVSGMERTEALRLVALLFEHGALRTGT